MARRHYARSLRQLAREHPEPVRTLAALAGVDATVLERWIRYGKSQLLLEGYEGVRGGWVSSGPAVARFLAELAWREG